MDDATCKRVSDDISAARCWVGGWVGADSKGVSQSHANRLSEGLTDSRTPGLTHAVEGGSFRRFPPGFGNRAGEASAHTGQVRGCGDNAPQVIHCRSRTVSEEVPRSAPIHVHVAVKCVEDLRKIWRGASSIENESMEGILESWAKILGEDSSLANQPTTLHLHVRPPAQSFLFDPLPLQ